MMNLSDARLPGMAATTQAATDRVPTAGKLQVWR